MEAEKECFKKVGMTSKAKCHLDAEQDKDRKVTFGFGNISISPTGTYVEKRNFSTLIEMEIALE